MSGETVATMQAPISSGRTPARARASPAAFTHRSVWVSVVQWRRVLMPVRVVIHSSLVSTIFARSWLVMMFSGTQRPVPLILIPFIGSPSRERPLPFS